MLSENQFKYVQYTVFVLFQSELQHDKIVSHRIHTLQGGYTNRGSCIGLLCEVCVNVNVKACDEQ